MYFISFSFVSRACFVGSRVWKQFEKSFCSLFFFHKNLSISIGEKTEQIKVEFV